MMKMDLTLLKNKYVIAGFVGVSAIALIFALRKPSVPSEVIMTASGLGADKDLIMAAQNYALSNAQIQAEKEISLKGLENERYDSDLALNLVKENNATYLSGLESENRAALASQVSSQNYNLATQLQVNAIARHKIDSAERLKEYQMRSDATAKRRQIESDERIKKQQLEGDERLKSYRLQIDNAALSVKQTLGLKSLDIAQSEINQAYNLQNYQAAIQHDVSKQNAKNAFYGGFFNSIFGGLTSLF